MIVKLIHSQTEALANTFSSFNKGFGFKKRVKIMCYQTNWGSEGF